MAAVFLLGDSVTYQNVILEGESSWTVGFFDTGTAGFTLDDLYLDVATSVTIVSKGLVGGSDTLGRLVEQSNDLTTVTIKGSELFSLGSGTGNSDSGDGVVTNVATVVVGGAFDATATSPTTVQSSLTLIDASATSGGVIIYAGATSTLSAIPTTYTGLMIEGGSGSDFIENDAQNGIVTDGNGRDDTVDLGGSGARAILGTGTDDTVIVGVSNLGTTETAGSALGDSVTFGAAATASLVVGIGAEAGSTAGTTSIGQTKVHDAAGGMIINFGPIIPNSNIVNENAAVTGLTSLATAENAAVDAMAAPGVAYFNFKGSEYFIATNNTETAVSPSDAVVKLVGVTNLTATNAAGVVTLHA